MDDIKKDGISLKKILITAHSLEIGGIEKALINLLKRLDYTKYDVTLILEKKKGTLYSLLPKEVNVLEYRISNCKITFIRKIKNRLKLIWWQKKLRNRYDFACSFATYSIPGAYLALAASSNNALWLHGNYYVNYKKDEKLMREFLDSVMIKKFKRLIFVSYDNLNDVSAHYPGLKEKALVCNNFIDGEAMLENASKKCDFKKEITPTFLNVGRHDEYQKSLTRIINATKRLIDEGYTFQVLFIGDGPDTKMYQEMVKQKQLTNIILFLGKKQNPYPYYNLCDAVLLSSNCEGYPVVFLESRVMKKPIVSTKVSDYKPLDGKAGIFKDKSTTGVYEAMKEYLDNGFDLKEQFDYHKFNSQIDSIITKIINDEYEKC